VRRRPRVGIPGALDAFAFRVGESPLGEIGQFEIVEEQVDELVAVENEPERVLAVTFAGPGCLSLPLAGTRQDIALDIFLVAGKHHIADAALAVQARLVHPIERDADLAALQDVLDVAVLRHLLDRVLNQRLCAAQEPLPVLEAFASRVQAPVDDVHGHLYIGFNQPASRACTTRRAGEPDAWCSRAPPFAGRILRASSRYLHPSSIRTR